MLNNYDPRDDELKTAKEAYDMILKTCTWEQQQMKMELWFLFSTQWLFSNDYTFDELLTDMKVQHKNYSNKFERIRNELH